MSSPRLSVRFEIMLPRSGTVCYSIEGISPADSGHSARIPGGGGGPFPSPPLGESTETSSLRHQLQVEVLLTDSEALAKEPGMAVRLRRHGGIPLHKLTVKKVNVTVGLSRAGPGPGLGTAARDCGPAWHWQ